MRSIIPCARKNVASPPNTFAASERYQWTVIVAISRGGQYHHAENQRVGDRFAVLRDFGLGVGLPHELDDSDGRASLQEAFGVNWKFSMHGQLLRALSRFDAALMYLRPAFFINVGMLISVTIISLF